MKKILFIAFIFLFKITTYAEELPPLPADTSINSISDHGESFWSKILNFFGFGEKQEKEEKISEISKDVNIPEKIITPPSSDNDIKDSNQTPLKLPSGFEDDKNTGDTKTETQKTIPQIQPEVEKHEPSVTDKNSDQTTLKLPSGFEDDKNTGDTKTETQKTIPQIQPEVEKHELLPEQQIIQNPKIENISEQKITSELVPAAKKDEKPIELSIPVQSDNKSSDTTTNVSASINKTIDEYSKQKNNSVIAKYREQFENRLNQPQQLPEIPKEELVKTSEVNVVKVNENNSKSDDNGANNDSLQIKFINDETQVLTLSNDDIVLGELTEEAKMDLMDFSSYVPIFWKNYYIVKNEPERRKINNFIKKYGHDFNLRSKIEIKDAFAQALMDIEIDKIYDLAALLDNYEILQMVDQCGNNLLHKAIYSNNYSAAKLLVLKGINISAINNDGNSPMDIAIDTNNLTIIALLKSAGIHGRSY